VITRHRPATLQTCLELLHQQTVPATEIVVVDSSEDRRSEDVCRSFPNVTYVRFENGRNQMPASRNLAIVNSRSDIIGFLDDDSFADPDWIEKHLETYAKYPKCAGVGGRITDARYVFNPSLPIGQVDNLGRVIPNFFGDPGRIPIADALPGNNMSYRREWLNRVGGFDPAYNCTNHREDPDIGVRISRAGGRLRYQPAAHALHLAARHALGELRWWHEFYLRYSFARNDTYFVLKHFGGRPAAVWRILVLDVFSFSRSVAESGSLVVWATLPVYFVAKAAGVIASLRYHAARLMWGPECHFPTAATPAFAGKKAPEAISADATGAL
jgi:GT2 family glycosyltransferase